jgi:hypothetical protein
VQLFFTQIRKREFLEMRRPWSKEDVRLLKALVREKTKTSVVARKLKRTEGAIRQNASVLGVKLAGAQERKR